MIMKTIFQCPCCGKQLKQGKKQYFCSNGHSFDIARQGHVNLLLPQHIGAGKPGDSKEMIKSRREFLDRGYYEKFSDTLNHIVLNTLAGNPDDRSAILDAGCGEGYYLSRLNKQINSSDSQKKVDLYGIDVSKPAIQYAAGRDKEIRYAVASNYHIPVSSGSSDYILCIFSPRDQQEFKRILKPSGMLLVAAPGPRHLYSLREFLYKDPEIIGQKGTVEKGFKLVEQYNVSYEIGLKNTQDLFNLFKMTPYSRHAEIETENKLKTIGEFVTEVDIILMLYQKI